MIASTSRVVCTTCVTECTSLFENYRPPSTSNLAYFRKSLWARGNFRLKTVLLVGCIVVSLSAAAQFKSGDKFLGGQVAFTTYNSSEADAINNDVTRKSNSFAFHPFVGFFVNDSWALGGLIGYTTGYRKDNYNTVSVQTTKDHSILLGVFARRYFTISDKFYFVLHGESFFGRGSRKTTSTTTSGGAEQTSKSFNIGINVQPMLIFFPSRQWGIQGGLGAVSYSHTRSLSTDAKNNNFGIRYGDFSLGVTYYLYKPE